AHSHLQHFVKTAAMEWPNQSLLPDSDSESEQAAGFQLPEYASAQVSSAVPDQQKSVPAQHRRLNTIVPDSLITSRMWDIFLHIKQVHQSRKYRDQRFFRTLTTSRQGHHQTVLNIASHATA